MTGGAAPCSKQYAKCLGKPHIDIPGLASFLTPGNVPVDKKTHSQHAGSRCNCKTIDARGTLR